MGTGRVDNSAKEKLAEVLSYTPSVGTNKKVQINDKFFVRITNCSYHIEIIQVGGGEGGGTTRWVFTLRAR